MISPDWLYTDPIPSRVKGWVPRAGGGVRLRQAYLSSAYGAGQEPPTRDDWYSSPDAMGVAPPSQTADGGGLENETPGSAPASISPPPSAPPASRAPSGMRTLPGPPPGTRDPQPFQTLPSAPPTSKPDPNTWEPLSTVAVSGTQDVGGDWSSGLSMVGDVAMNDAELDPEGAMVAQAIARTEGGLFGALGDNSQSFGVYQFYMGGQLANFARDMGMTEKQAGQYAVSHPREAAAWALKGYLGNAIRQGQRMGLHGAALATYAQQHGQVSVSPERAGQWYSTLFGSGGQPILDRASSPVSAGSRYAPWNNQPVQPNFPQNAGVKKWFSYSDNGREIMEIEWDNGQTTFHDIGSTQDPNQGTVLETGSLGAGQDVYDPGTGDNQSEWPIPDTGSPPTTTSAPPPPTRDDWSRQAPSTGSADSSTSVGTQSSDTQTEWTVPTPPSTSSPAPVNVDQTATTSVPSAAGAQTTDTSTSENQTEWQIPAPIQNALSTVSSTIGGAASAVGQKASDLVASPGGPTPAGAQPTPSDQLTNPIEYARANQAAVPSLPDITPALAAPDPSTPLGQVVQAGVEGQSTPAATQLAAVPQWAGSYEEARGQAATNVLSTVGAQDIPVISGALEDATDPAMWFPTGPLERGAGKVLGAARDVAGKAIDHIPGVGKAAADLWDPLTHTFQSSWDKIMPDAISSRVPAAATPKLAMEAGVGAATGGGYYATHPDDPNRVGDSLVAGTLGVAGAYAALDVVPAAVKALADSPIGAAFKHEFAPATLLPSPVRDAITARANRLNAARGENWLWQNRIEDALGKSGQGYNNLSFQKFVEEFGTAPPGSSAEVKQLVDDMVKYTTDTGDEGRRLGYINGDITTRPDNRGVTLRAYMPRVLNDAINQAKDFPGVWHGKLTPKDTFSYMRQHLSLQDAEDAGVLDQYHNSISKSFGHYAEHVNASRANALFIKDLKKLAPNTIARIKSPKNVSTIGNGDWIWGGNYLKQWQNVAFSPELKTVLDNITSPGAQSPFWRGSLNLMAEAKNALFAPSLFHLGNEVRQVFNAAGVQGLGILPKTAFYMIPGAGQNAARKFWTNPSVIASAREAMDAGLVLMRRMPDVGEGGLSGVKSKVAQAGWGAATAGAAGYMNARFDQTLTDQERIQRGLEAAGIGAVGGMVGGALSRMLWSDTVPYMKLMTWKLLEPKYGKEAAASFVNSVYGGQNLEAIARSRKVQDVLRTTVLAPDWQEGWVRQIGNAFMPGPVGDMNRQYWARSAVTAAFMLEGLNVALNGHPTAGIPGGPDLNVLGRDINTSTGNGPGHELTLELTGLYDMNGWGHSDPQTGENYRTYVDILGPYRGLLNAPLNPGSFLAARQGLIPEELGTAISGKDWRGKDIAPPGTDPVQAVGLKAAYLLSRMAPVGPAEVIRTTSQPSNEPLPLQVGLGVGGLRETRQSPLQLAVQQRDQEYQNLGVNVDQEQQINTQYSGMLKEAETKTSQAFDPSKTGSDIVREVQDVTWPNRQDLVAPLEPASIAADPIKNADWVTKMRSIQSIGTQSSEAPADIDPSHVPLDSVSSAYWSPPGKTTDQMASLPADAQDRAREAALVQQAQQYGVDPNALRDAVKAQARGETIQPLPNVSSAQLDDWVNQWRSTTDPDIQVQAQKRRDVIDQIASQYNVDPSAVYQRIKLRTLPLVHEDPNEPGISPDEKQRREMQTSYERAQDALYNSKDASNFPRYANPDGTAYKGSTPAQWDTFDQQIAADTKAGRRTHTPEVQALIDAKNTANSGRLKALMKDPAYNDYQRWYGVGRNMDQTHWNQYVSGQGHQFTDITDPTEARRRTRTLELWTASTPQERQTTKVKIKVVVGGQVREEVTTLDQAKKHIAQFTDPAWKTNLGVDTTGATQ